jgi:TetR/AcrR family transcriptional repressor of mexJK operon
MVPAMTRDSRAAILRATVGLLRSGDGAFTYEHLAAQAGVARQTLYSHFPDRAELLVAAVEQVRGELDLDELTSAVYTAPTARTALEALLELHIAFTPPLLAGLRAVEAQRAAHPDVSEAFERRSSGRRQLALHVITRLHAEGDLAAEWSVVDAADLVGALLAGGFTSELLEERRWTTGQLHDCLRHTISHALLRPSAEPATTAQRTNHATGGTTT